MVKPPGKCIFCGGGGLSKEHIYPEWIQSVLPKKFAGDNHEISRSALPDGSTAAVANSYRPTQQGDPLVRKLYAVCRLCNNGWMGKLQEGAKIILTPLLCGDWSALTTEQQGAIAAWAAMTTMVAEYRDPPTVGVPQSDRTYLLNNRRAPERWQIWMGHFSGRQDRSFWHTSFINYSDEVPFSVTEDAKGQVTTLRIGQLVFALLSTPSGLSVMLDSAFMLANGLAPIWPPNGNVARSVRPVDDNGADRIHGFIRGIFA